MGLRPTQGDENRLKGTAFRPSINTTIIVATEGNIFDRAQRSGATAVYSTGTQLDRKRCLFIGSAAEDLQFIFNLHPI